MAYPPCPIEVRRGVRADRESAPEMMIYPIPDFTPSERRAWEALASAANLMLRLSSVHPADRSETVRDIHNLQNRMLARATYPMGSR